MTTIQSKRQDIGKYALREFVYLLGLVGLALLFAIYGQKKTAVQLRYSAISAGVLFVFYSGRILLVKELVAVEFDDQKEELKFLFRGIISKAKTKIIPYQFLTIEVIRNTPSFRIFGRSIEVYFSNKRTEFCYIRSSKSGFSYGDVESVVDLINNIVQKRELAISKSGEPTDIIPE